MALDGKAWAEQDILLEQSSYHNWPDDAWMAIRLCALPWPLRMNSEFELDIGTDPTIIRRLARR